MGLYEQRKTQKRNTIPYFVLILSFFLIEVFAFFYLREDGAYSSGQLWPLAFGLV